MSDVTHILDRVQQGDRRAAEELLPPVYQELRKLAAAKMAQQAPGQTLQATALVHEAWPLSANEEIRRLLLNTRCASFSHKKDRRAMVGSPVLNPR